MVNEIRQIIFDTVHKDYFAMILKERLNYCCGDYFTVKDIIVNNKSFYLTVIPNCTTTFECIKKQLHDFFGGVDPVKVPSFDHRLEYKIYWEDLFKGEKTNKLNKEYRRNMHDIELNVRNIEKNLKNIKNFTKKC